MQLVVVVEGTHLPAEGAVTRRSQPELLREGLVVLVDPAITGEVERGEVRVDILVFLVLAKSRDGGQVEPTVFVVHLH